MTKPRLKPPATLVATCAVLAAFFAIPALAQAAEAPHWKLSTGLLGEKEEKTFEAKSTGEVKLEGSALKLKSAAGNCTSKGKIKGSAAGIPGEVVGSPTLSCLNVQVIGSEKACVVKSVGSGSGNPGEIVTKALKGTLVWKEQAAKSQAAGILFEPTGANYVEISVSSAPEHTCPVARTEPYVVTGKTVGWVTPVATLTKVGTLTFPSPAATAYWNNSEPRVEVPVAGLRIGEAVETFSGPFEIKLNPEAEVGIFGA